MKKFTLLILAILLCVGSAWAKVITTTPVAGTEYYIKCVATDHTGNLADDGTTLQGRAATGTKFVLEATGTDGHYYLKSVKSGKYINAADNTTGSAITFDATASTYWTLDQTNANTSLNSWAIRPNGTEGVSLNNNGSSDAACPYMKVNVHSNSGQGCDLWTFDDGLGVIATTKSLVDAATVNTATAATGWTNTIENGGIYTFGSDTYIGAATNGFVTDAFAGTGYVTVACWVYGQPTGCVFGFGEHSNGVKFYVNGTTMAMTTKGVSDFATQYDCNLKDDQWNFIAYTIPGTGNTSATNSRFYYTTTNGNFNSKGVSNMAATSNNQCAIGSGNSDNARETFTGTMANLTIITSDALLNNSEIAALVGAAPLKTDLAYLIKNMKSGGYMSLSETVSGEVSLQNIGNCEPIYFETTSTDGAFKIKNAAESGVKYIDSWYWYATPKDETGDAWQIEPVDYEGAYAVRIKGPDGYLAPDATSLPVALWSDKKADHAYGVYQLIEADLSYFETELSNKIAEIEAMIGTDPGCYSEDDARDIITAAQTALAAEARTIASLQEAYNTLTEDISFLDIILPERGKTYQIVSALPAFKEKQGVEKAMYANGDNLSWATLDELNKAYYWTLETTPEGYTMKNCSETATKLYPGVQGSTSSGYPMAEDAVNVTLASLGNKQFTIKTDGSKNAMHCGGHSNGAGISSNIVCWDGAANSASAWYIREVEIPTIITYQIKDGEDVIWSQVKAGEIGKAYPTPEWHNTFVTLSGVPSETLTAGDKTVVLTANTTNMPVAISADVEGATYYALDIHGNEAKYPLYYNSSDATNVNVEYTTNAEFYTDGATKSDAYAWAFIGDAIRGFKVYNKATGQYMVQTNDADEKITFGDEGTLFQIYNTASGLANSFAIKVTDRNNYLNHRGSYLQGWTAADAGSSFRAYPINMVDDASYEVTINEDKFSTLIVPFYTEIPDGMNVYTVVSVTGSTVNLTPVSDLIKPNTAYIVNGAGDYNLSNTSQSNDAGTIDYTTGLLTGVLTEGGATIPTGSYVLATRNSDDHQAFFKTDGTVTCPQYKCYLTVPASSESSRFLTFPDDDLTGLEGFNIVIEDANAPIYDLQGRKVANTVKGGIYIKNGKKFIAQ